eukprot:6906868-Lingulodinium_polyedra.AAC.1
MRRRQRPRKAGGGGLPGFRAGPGRWHRGRLGRSGAMRRAALEGGGQRGGGCGSSVGRAPGAGSGQLEGGPRPRAGG